MMLHFNEHPQHTDSSQTMGPSSALWSPIIATRMSVCPGSYYRAYVVTCNNNGGQIVCSCGCYVDSVRLWFSQQLPVCFSPSFFGFCSFTHAISLALQGFFPPSSFTVAQLCSFLQFLQLWLLVSAPPPLSFPSALLTLLPLFYICPGSCQFGFLSSSLSSPPPHSVASH